MVDDLQLSENFWLSEFTISPAADHNGVANAPRGQRRLKIFTGSANWSSSRLGTHLVRYEFSSGFRSARLNAMVGGTATSGHRLGNAADVVPVIASTLLFAEWVVINSPRFDQVILEFGTIENPNWIHVSVDSRNRRQVLRALRKVGRTFYEPVQIAESLHASLPATERVELVSKRRSRIAAQILSWEARRDKQGRLAVYEPPTGDGGGSYEVAGINARYHPDHVVELRRLIESGKHTEAEAQAIEYIASETDAATRWTKVPAIEAFLRDCCFNRGVRGAGKIFQLALGVDPDGAVGHATLTAAALAETTAPPFCRHFEKRGRVLKRLGREVRIKQILEGFGEQME